MVITNTVEILRLLMHLNKCFYFYISEAELVMIHADPEKFDFTI